ncbi:aromatic/alkene monooxygenase hydroxylase subunit gamma [Candidatus Methylocalor cossyra]|uniref:Methane monooxygenase component A gamma chain n=1 Tax=Candidatus Methylocalor cossyra TaxID=3108543 RepID=A0ABP1C4N7_9GAMM
MANYPIHENPVRDQWADKIGALKDLNKAVAMLKQFRVDHILPSRKSNELWLDYLWIENKLEEKVAVLKLNTFSDQDFLTKTADGQDAKTVAEGWIAKMHGAKDKWEAERIHWQFRQECKPPLMPVNVWMDTDRQLGTRLMELRNLNYYDTPLDELRKQRGVRVIVAH